MCAQVDSTSDERVVNNTMRHKYRVLTDAEKQIMQELKDMGEAFDKRLRELFHESADPERERCYRIAAERNEEAVMWAVKGLTK